MSTLSYEEYRIKREIDIHGMEYEVLRKKVDKRGEAMEGFEKVGTIHGLYHVVKEYVTDKISNATHTHSKGKPKLLVMFSDVAGIVKGDLITINKKKYKIVEINDINESSIACDISLEVVIDGR